MGTFLKVTGYIVLIAGIIVGIVFYSGASDDKDNLKIAKESYDELYTNEFAEAAYTSARQIYLNDMSIVVLSVGLGIIGGLIGIGTGEIVSRLENRDTISRRPSTVEEVYGNK